MDGVPYAVLCNGPLPVQRAWVPLTGLHHQRLTALYGPNGVGKTVLLEAVRAAVDGLSFRGQPSPGGVGVVGAAYAPTVFFVRGFGLGPAADEIPPALGTKSFHDAIGTALVGLNEPARRCADVALERGDFALVPCSGRVDAWIAVQRSDELLDYSRPHWPDPQALRDSPRRGCDVPALVPEVPIGALPPPPDLFGLPQDPSWAPAPLVKVASLPGFGTVGGPVPAHIRIDEISDANLAATTARLAETWYGEAREAGPMPRVDAAPPHDLAAWASVEAKFWLEDTVAFSLGRLLPSASFTLAVGFSVDGHSLQAHWWADLENEVLIELADLSSAEERWARAALAEALLLLARPSFVDLGGLTFDAGAAPPSLVTVDEPERGLHRQAVRQLRDRLTSGPSLVVAATHAFEFLETRRDIAHVVVQRTDRGVRAHLATVRPGDDEEETLGASETDLRTLYRGLLFVEGPHDELVVRRWLGSDLDELGVLVVPIFSPYSEGDAYLAPPSDGHVLAAVELIAGPVCYLIDAGQSRLDALADTVARVSPRQAEREVERLRRQHHRDRFTVSFCNVLLWASRHGYQERLRIVQHDRRDIADFLPCGFFADGRFNDWTEARRASGHEFDGEAFKRFMGVNRESIRRALDATPAPPAAFVAVATRLTAVFAPISSRHDDAGESPRRRRASPRV